MSDATIYTKYNNYGWQRFLIDQISYWFTEISLLNKRGTEVIKVEHYIILSTLSLFLIQLIRDSSDFNHRFYIVTYVSGT